MSPLKCNLDVAIQVCFGCQTTRFGVILPKPLRSIIIPRFRSELVCPFCWHCCQPANRADVGAEWFRCLLCAAQIGAPGTVLSVEIHGWVRCVWPLHNTPSRTPATTPNLKKTWRNQLLNFVKTLDRTPENDYNWSVPTLPWNSWRY